jgi:hypothetical protein
MMHSVRGLGLAASLVLVSTLAVAPKASAASTPTAAAYVYIQIQGAAGAVYGLSASSTGQLSAIPGAPWKPAGQIIGSTSTKFFTLGADLIHSYGIASNGALQAQLAQMPILDYTGSDCGGGSTGEDGAVLDHTGKYIYVMLDDGFRYNESCGAYQAYLINSDGSFAFDGETQITGPLNTGDSFYGFGLPSILGNETFAYSEYNAGGPPENEYLSGFRRESSGTLDYSLQIDATAPTIPNGYYAALSPDASPAGNYVVLQLFPEWTAPPATGSLYGEFRREPLQHQHLQQHADFVI